VQYLKDSLTPERVHFKRFLGSPVNVPKRDKPNREISVVWSAQGEGASSVMRRRAICCCAMGESLCFRQRGNI
jgi:hypothetical protein